MNRIALVVALSGLAFLLFFLLSGGRSERNTEAAAPLPEAEPVRPTLAAPREEAPAREATVALPAPEPAAPAPSVAAPRAPGPCTVFGRVTDAELHPIRGWLPAVSCIDARGEATAHETDAEGNYTLADLASGSWTLRCEAVGYREHVENVELSPAQPRLRQDIVLERAIVLRVRAETPDGRPFTRALRDVPADVAGFTTRYSFRAVASTTKDGPRAHELHPRDAPASMAAMMWCANSPSGACLANENGIGAFFGAGPPVEGLGPEYLGVLVLDGDLPVFVSLLRGADVLATQRVEPGSEEVRFVLDPAPTLVRGASLKLRAIDSETHEPLHGKVVVHTAVVEPEGKLAADGTVAFQGLEPTRCELSFLVDGHESLSRPLELAPGETRDLGDVALQPARRIEAHVVDAEGHAVATSFVLGTLASDGAHFNDSWIFESDAQGRLVIDGLRAERYVLRTSDAPAPGTAPTWVAACTEVSTLAGSIAGLELRLVRAGELVLAHTAALPARSGFRLRDAHGSELFSGTFFPGWLPRFALAPGEYTLELVGPEGNATGSRAVEVREALTEVDVSR